jgi:hypothetical protein
VEPESRIQTALFLSRCNSSNFILHPGLQYLGVVATGA